MGNLSNYNNQMNPNTGSNKMASYNPGLGSLKMPTTKLMVIKKALI